MYGYNFIAGKFLPQDFQSTEGKKLAFLWLMLKEGNGGIEFSNAQSLVPMYQSELMSLSPEKIYSELLETLESDTHPSHVSKWINTIEVLGLGWMKDRLGATGHSHYISPAFDIREEIIETEEGLQPPTAFLCQLNTVDAQLTGYLIENVLAMIIDPRILNVEEFPACVGSDIRWREENLSLYRAILCNQFGEFKTKYHILLWKTIEQYFAINFSSEAVYKVATFLDFFVRVFPEAFVFLDKYAHELEKTLPVLSFKRRYESNPIFPFHGVELVGEIEGKKYTGEADFIIDDFILDAKACKTPTVNTWFNQTNIYRQLVKDRTIRGLKVISFLNNRVYSVSM